MNIKPIVIAIAGRDLTFKVAVERDEDASAPWEKCDEHGPVSDWEKRDKRSGEMVLNASHGEKRFYDFAEACKIARRDGWDNVATRPDHPETPRMKAARAALADFEYLRGWCRDEWEYLSVRVTLLNPDGSESEISTYVGGVESTDESNVEEWARTLAKDLFVSYWHTVGRRLAGSVQAWRSGVLKP